MVVLAGVIYLDCPQTYGLKGRRKILSSLKEKLRHMNLSVKDVSGEYPKEGAIAIAGVNLSANESRDMIEKIEKLLDVSIPDCRYELEYDLL